VESQNFLGIYLRKETASVVCIESNGSKESVVDAFFVSIEDQEEHNIPVLVNRIGQKIAEKEIQYSQAAVALDCAMFMQHKIHSDFNDPKQMAQTIRFDAEEILARDVSNIAIAFKINSSNETGSELTIFTVEKDLLADIIAALQSNRMDPVTIEPDAYCLKRFLSERFDISGNTLFTVLSKHNTYIVPMGPSEHLQQTPPRTFLLDIKRDKMQALTSKRNSNHYCTFGT
jgi:Tfp pilus assembly PilM family ATPase